MIKSRVASGHLVPLHRGVYAVGHRRLRREGFWLAAVLAAGRGAALSHRDAAGLHGLRPANHVGVDVTTPRRAADAPGIRVHRAALAADDVIVRDGVPVTTVARTLVDLAGVVPAHHLAKALDEAERLRVLDLRTLGEATARTRTRRGRGHRALREVLADLRARRIQLTRSDLEDRFLALLDAHGLPRPRTNAVVEGMEVDALWSAKRLVVELDGWAFHHTATAFQRDRERSNDLARAGYQVLRFTHGDVVRRPHDLAARVAEALR
jgi:very-short-patch-repair endonuclease